MKKIKIAALFTALILLIAGAAVLYIKNTQAKAYESFTLYLEEGDVFYKREGQKYTKLTTDEILLTNHSSIKTETGSAHILFADNSMITIDQDTEIKINFEGQKTQIFQVAGNTWHRVKSLTEKQGYEVKTDDTLATVRGTKFSVSKLLDEDTVYVSDSIVEVQEINNPETKSRPVTTGEMAKMMKKDKNMSIIKMDQNTQATPWYKKNLEIDKDYERAKTIRPLKNMIRNFRRDQKFKDLNQIRTKELHPDIETSTENIFVDFSTAETCDDINSEVFDAEVKKYNDNKTLFYDRASKIDTYIDLAKSTCSDGVMTPDEAQTLNQLAQEINK